MGLIIALPILFAGFMVFRIVQTIQHFRAHPLQHAPGYEELSQAETIITTPRRGLAHGNTQEAALIAKQVSSEMKTLLQAAFVRSKIGESDQPITEGEFVIFCQMNEHSCAFLIHVPKLIHFSSEAKEAMAGIAYTVACNVLSPEYKKELKRLAVATRGVMMYDRIWIGEEGFSDEDPASHSKEIKHDRMLANALYPFFAPEQSAMRSEVGAPIVPSTE